MKTAALVWTRKDPVEVGGILRQPNVPFEGDARLANCAGFKIAERASSPPPGGAKKKGGE